jgi:hypothetical protein
MRIDNGIEYLQSKVRHANLIDVREGQCHVKLDGPKVFYDAVDFSSYISRWSLDAEIVLGPEPHLRRRSKKMR